MFTWYPFPLVSTLVLSFVTRGQCINACLDPASFSYKCSGTDMFLSSCGLTDDDLEDVASCFAAAGVGDITSVSLSRNLLTSLPGDLFSGMTSLTWLVLHENGLTELPDGIFSDLTSLTNLFLQSNAFTTLPEGLFSGLSSLSMINLDNNDLTTLPDGVFSGLSSLSTLSVNFNDLTTLPDGVFSGLSSLSTLDVRGNMLSTLPAGIFDDLTSLSSLQLEMEFAASRTNDIQCMPLLPTSPTVEYETPDGTCECVLPGMSQEEALVILCPLNDPCEPGTTGYTCGQDVGGTGDPHMVGFSGQKFDFTGEDGSWYAVLKDGLIHINMRVTAPLRGLKEITYITGTSMIVADLDGDMHTMSIYVSDPNTLESACPVDISPCLGNGALTILLDGQQVISPGQATLGRGVTFGAVNLPGACRPFGFEQYWARKVMEAEESAAGAGRRLQDTVGVCMAEWIISDRLATNKPECEAYVKGAADDLFSHQSEHVSFQLNSPTFTMRLNYGKLHQLAVRDPTDQFDLPDHLTHQMNLGLSRVTLGDFPEGIIGETVAVRTDMHGLPIVTGSSVISGNEEDYKVEGALGTSFNQASDGVNE